MNNNIQFNLKFFDKYYKSYVIKSSFYFEEKGK